VTVLGALDLIVLVLARWTIRALRELPATSDIATTLFPLGTLGGGGAVAAVLVGLALVGAYASEERWASVETVLKGVALGVALALSQSIDTEGVSWAAARWFMVSAALGCALGSARWVLAGFVFRNRLASYDDRVLVVGDPWSVGGRQALKALEERPGAKCVGWLSEKAGDSDYLGHPSAVWEVLSATGADTVLLCGDLQSELFDAVVEAAAVSGCRVWPSTNTRP
jgi:hypothetical protein